MLTRMWDAQQKSRSCTDPTGLRRREAIALWAKVAVLSVLLVRRGCAGVAAGADEDRTEWEGFKRRFVLGDGRVVDAGSGRISHAH